MFDAFTQAEASTSRKYGGTGLGLPIARQLCELMGGTIDVESSLGRGSTFRASFVVAESIPDSKRHDSRLAGLPAEPDRFPAVGSTADSQLAHRYPLRILVAEDNHVNQKMIVAQLRRLGYQADVVSNGAEAIQAAGVRSYDVILMDLHMPEVDGLTAARAIRNGSEESRPVIVALTADVTPEACAECDEAGMRAYITKPIRETELRAALADVVGGDPAGGRKVS